MDDGGRLTGLGGEGKGGGFTWASQVEPVFARNCYTRLFRASIECLRYRRVKSEHTVELSLKFLAGRLNLFILGSLLPAVDVDEEWTGEGILTRRYPKISGETKCSFLKVSTWGEESWSIAFLQNI